jgi:3'-phosphoadenosine 5'-phosphosulfate sulfotransferase (PAPS reductase)/FAD synthetase
MEALNRHKNIALQFSGGRDSLACLYLLRDHLDKITVYWVNSGDAFPETLAVISHILEFVPNFVEIDGNQPGVIAAHGIPTDLLPKSSAPIGLLSARSSVPMQDSYSCCARVVMMPMAQRMVDDGVTLVIRGQRADDGHRSPINSGYSENGIEYLFPIEQWSAPEVDAFLKNVGAPVAPFYEHGLDTTPDCMGCTGWWSERRAQYLKQFHPDAYQRYQRGLNIICTETAAHIANFNTEIG